MAKYDPVATRQRLLDAACAELLESGMHTASLEGILSRAGVTKGALYHHFDGKAALCGAVIDEVLRPRIEKSWLEPLESADDPVSVLEDLLAECVRTVDREAVRFGSPLNNLSQEISATDEDLRRRVDSIYALWVGAIRDALSRGQLSGTLRRDVRPAKAARFIVAAVEGAHGIAKSARDLDVLRDVLEELSRFLETLRPESSRPHTAE